MESAVKSVVEIGVAVNPIREAKPLYTSLSGRVNSGTSMARGL